MQRARNTAEERCDIFDGYSSGWNRVDSSHSALKIVQCRGIALNVGRKQTGARKDEEYVDKRRQCALRFGTSPLESSVLKEGLHVKWRDEVERDFT